MCLVLRLLSLNIGLWYSYEIPSGILVIMNEKILNTTVTG